MKLRFVPIGFGELLGGSNQHISKMELGKTRIFAAQLADYYNVSISYFCI
jgi:hypothetical protein